MAIRSWLRSAVAISVLGCGPALAQQTFTFSGTITQRDWALDPAFVNYADFEIGDPFSVAFTWADGGISSYMGSSADPFGQTYSYNVGISSALTVDGLDFSGTGGTLS